MPDQTSTRQQKTNEFFKTAFIVLLMIVLISLSFITGILFQREYIDKKNKTSANRNSQAAPSGSSLASPTPTIEATPRSNGVSPTPITTTAPVVTRKTYTDLKYSFTMTYPSGWNNVVETNTKCSPNTAGTHICEYINFTNPSNASSNLRIEVTNNFDMGVLGNYSSIETNYKGYLKQIKQLDFNAVKLDRVLFIKDNNVKFICFTPSGVACGKSALQVQNNLIQIYVGNPAGENNTDSNISAADIEVMDTIVGSFKKI